MERLNEKVFDDLTGLNNHRYRRAAGALVTAFPINVVTGMPTLR